MGTVLIRIGLPLRVVEASAAFISSTRGLNIGLEQSAEGFGYITVKRVFKGLL